MRDFQSLFQTVGMVMGFLSFLFLPVYDVEVSNLLRSSLYERKGKESNERNEVAFITLYPSDAKQGVKYQGRPGVS